MTIYAWIKELINYAVKNQLVAEADVVDTTNQLLELFQLDTYDDSETVTADVELAVILKAMLDYACEQGLIEDSIVYRDLFDTRIMGKLVPKPSSVIKAFSEHYQQSPQAATDYFYKFSQDSDYIRRYRIKKDIKWEVQTQYGIMEMTINLSKPEKDPKAIAAAAKAQQSDYPKCQLCKENEGYAGRVNHPARQNHRIIPLTIQGKPWWLQYSPYVYYNEHCIVFNDEHTPMMINGAAFRKLLDFVGQFPHYFVGSNADLPIVGGSILSHEHFQGGCHDFPMAKAPVETWCSIPGFEDIKTGIVKWPMSVIRISGEDPKRLADLAELILGRWREYSDESAFIFAETDGVPHNTITPIARRRDQTYEMDLVLRNNITTKEHPLGVYHPHSNLHHIKKENIGLIEVMGLAVLPARLKQELGLLEQTLLAGQDPKQVEAIAAHADWAVEIMEKYDDINADNLHQIIEQETGYVFEKVLEDAGVYKRTAEGKAAFLRFLANIS